MKNLLIVITTILLTSNLCAQISVVDNSEQILIGEVKEFGQSVFKCEKNEDEYTFTYLNTLTELVGDYMEFKIIDEDNSFESLYSMIMKGFKDKKSDVIKIQTHENILGLEFNKRIGFFGFRFVEYVNGEAIGWSDDLSKRQVNKLFGK